MDFVQAIFLAAAFVAAGLIQGALGFGLSAMALALLGIMPCTGAADAAFASMIVANGWQLFDGPRLTKLLRRFGALGAGIVLGGFALPHAVRRGPDLSLAVGCTILLLAFSGLVFGRQRLSDRQEIWASPVVGLCTGALAGTGMIAVPVIPYLHALELDREELVQALGFSVLMSILAMRSDWTVPAGIAPDALRAIWLVVPAMAGLYLGQAVRRELDARAFERWSGSGIIFLGSSLLASA